MNNKDWYESLDNILSKLNDGDYQNQSINEFEKAVKSTYQSTNANKQSSFFDDVVPRINRTVESSSYSSRYQQVVKCLENVMYNNYPQTKKEGYTQCVNHYLDECMNHRNNLKSLETSVVSDIQTCTAKLKNTTSDDFLVGYYDALMMIKKVLYNSKIARLKELANKVNS